ncbi:hypothetical protein OG379_39075 [Streptomyces sp. NBC_01166]|uniref:hypothetical protein n=1 Tax=Streptomyces sp. NBC_01166 TaxID=2903755 RepID=UPI003863A491|nr:hypothetical protein OG379_39075 [Streptomyces sp. NBC_01166]
MSFDIFVCRFDNGEPTPLDMRTAQEVLNPYVVARDSRTNFLQVRTAEREEACVFFSSPGNITFNRFGGNGIMDLLAILLRRLDAVLVVPGGPTMIQRDEDRDLLPAALKDEWPVIVARTGAEIDRAIRAS